MKELVAVLLEAPDSQLAAVVKPYIRKWSEPPTALQVLEVVDYCINGALSSGVVLASLQVLYEQRCKAEGTTHVEVVKLATWRDRP